MSLEIFDGRPGDGKTYNAMALRILPHLARGGFVATNIEVRPEGIGRWIKARTGKKWRPDRLRFLEEHEVPVFHQHVPQGTEKTQVLVVLDEAHLWFNARDWVASDKTFRETFNLATQHRKYFLDIVLISQHFGNIDAQFLRLVEKLWRFKDFSKWHVPYFPWLKLPFFRFLAVCYDRNGKTIIDRYWQPFSKLVGDTYNTRAVSRGSQMGAAVEDVQLESDPVAAAKVRRIQGVITAILTILACAGVGALAYWWGGRTARKEAAVQAKATAKPAAGAVTTARPAVGESPASPAPADAKPEPKSGLKSAPPLEVAPLLWFAGPESDPILSMELDGIRQSFGRGSMTSRGRVTSIVRQGPRLWDVTFSPDLGAKRYTVRAVVKPYEGPIGAPGTAESWYTSAPLSSAGSLPGQPQMPVGSVTAAPTTHPAPAPFNVQP